MRADGTMGDGSEESPGPQDYHTTGGEPLGSGPDLSFGTGDISGSCIVTTILNMSLCPDGLRDHQGICTLPIGTSTSTSRPEIEAVVTFLNAIWAEGFDVWVSSPEVQGSLQGRLTTSTSTLRPEIEAVCPVFFIKRFLCFFSLNLAFVLKNTDSQRCFEGV